MWQQWYKWRCVQTWQKGHVVKRVIVSDESHRALRMASARLGWSIADYVEFLLSGRVPSVLAEATKRIRKERREKQNGKRKKA